MSTTTRKLFSEVISRFFLLIENKTGFSREDIGSKSRQQRLVYIRQSFGNIVYQNTDASLNEIGKVLNRNHATILAGMRYKNSENFDKRYREIYHLMRQLFDELTETFLSEAGNPLWDALADGKIQSPFLCKQTVEYIDKPEAVAGNVRVTVSNRFPEELPRTYKVRKISGRTIFTKTRNEKIFREFKEGATMQSLAETYNVTVERIRQVLAHDKQAYYEVIRQKEKEGWEENLKMFLEFTMKSGKIPSYKEALHNRVIKKMTLYKHLRVEAVKQGYEGHMQHKIKTHHASMREEILTYLKETAARLGYTPGQKEYKKDAKYHAMSIKYYFESLTNAQRLAGLVPNKPGNSHEHSVRNGRFISEKKCAEDLKILKQKLGHKPSWKEVEKYGNYTRATYLRKLSNLDDYIQYKYRSRQQKER